MRRDFLDRYSRLDSPVHRLSAAVKLLVALSVVVATVVIPIFGVAYFILVVSFLAGVAAASRISPHFLLKRLLFLEPFVLGVALLSLIQPSGGRVFATIVVKSTLCLFTMVLLANTTPFAELLRVLQRARVPALLVTTLALMYRYLFVLIDEVERMKRARASRTFARTHVHAWKTLATVIGQLFVRASERAERIYAAMCARGWK
jgi:cobalt/nickel transport system permease protein